MIHFLSRGFVAVVAVLALCWLGAWGTLVETRFALPGVACLGLWVVLSVGSAWSQGTLEKLPWGIWCVIMIAVGYMAWRSWTSAGVQGGERDLLLLGVGVSGWILASHLQWKGVFLVSFVIAGALLLGANIVVSGMQLAGQDWGPLHAWDIVPFSANEGRIRGLYLHYIFFGNLMAATALGCFAMLFWSGKASKWFQLICLFVAIICGILVFASWSRGAVLVLVLGVIMLGFLRVFTLQNLPYGSRIGVGIFLVLVLSALIWGGVQSQELAVHLEAQTGRSLSKTLEGEDVRILFWKGVVTAWQQSPWIGQGAQSLDFGYHRWWPDELRPAIGRPQFAHNEYLQLLADYGAIGVVLCLVALAACLYRGIACLALRASATEKKMSVRRRAVAFGMGIMLAFLLHAMTDFPLHVPFNTFFAGFGLGCLVSPAKQAAVKSNQGMILQPLIAIFIGGVVCLSSVQHLLGVPAWLEAKPTSIDQGYAVEMTPETALHRVEKLEQMKGMRRNESDWLLLAQLTNYLGYQVQNQNVEQVDVGWRHKALKASRYANMLNPNDPDALQMRVGLALALGRLEEAESLALRGWQQYRMRFHLYTFHLDLAQIAIKRGRRCLQRGDLVQAYFYGREAMAWLRMPLGAYHLRGKNTERWNFLKIEAEDLLALDAGGNL